MPRRNNRDETTGRRGQHGPVRRKWMDLAIPERCPCFKQQPCTKHPKDGYDG